MTDTTTEATPEVELKHDFTDEQIVEAASSLVARADGEARAFAQYQAAKTGERSRGHAAVTYPEGIPLLDHVAALQLRKEGHDVSISKGLFLNSITFPGREVVAVPRG